MFFELALALIFLNEGGHLTSVQANSIGDLGGETNLGITEVTLRALGITDVRVSELTKDKARSIYFEHYYSPIAEFELDSPELTLVLFDMAVQHGPQRAIKELQDQVGAVRDGHLGENTKKKVRKALTEKGSQRIILDLCARRRKFLIGWAHSDPRRQELVRGLIARVDRTERAALCLRSNICEKGEYSVL